MKVVLVIICLLCTAGCSSNTVLGSHVSSISRGIRNAQANDTYREAIGDHAEYGRLLGTWTWESPTKAVFDLPLHEDSLSLFDDGTYIKRRIGRSMQNTMVGITVEEGSWTREAPGMVALSPDKPDPRRQIAARTIDLNAWTNTFVEADRAIHAEE
ncbi:MAG: hypothetical protein AAF711_08135 [Planctomycetota bacterium]